MILFSSLVFISFLSRHWAIPENIDTGLYHERLLRFPKGRGGGSGLWNPQGIGGVFTIGNPKAWGNSTGGISGVESVE